MITVVKPDFVHGLLTRDREVDDEDEESWKGGLDLMNAPIQGVVYLYEPVELPFPLEKAGLLINSYDSIYFANFILSARDDSVFEILSEKLERELINPGLYQCCPTTSDEIGYIIDKENIIRASIVEASFVDKMDEIRIAREIAIGHFGGLPRRLGSLKDFKLAMHELTGYANQYIGACLKGDAKTKFRELELSLVP